MTLWHNLRHGIYVTKIYAWWIQTQVKISGKTSNRLRAFIGEIIQDKYLNTEN